MKMKELGTTLKLLPQPGPVHLEVLNDLLSNINNEFGLSDDDIRQRADLAQKVNEFVSREIPGKPAFKLT
jgi:hypothetical protein